MTLNASWTCCYSNRSFALVGLVVAVAVLVPVDASCQTDSTVNHPRQALQRAVLPGWGQWYNRQYVKIPVVYAGFGAFTWAALYTNGKYLTYRRAYLYTARKDANGEPVFPEYATEYAALLSDLGLEPEANLTDDEVVARRMHLEPQFRAFRDNYRRNRDLLYFGIAAWYGLTVIDAFVSAHLTDFDIGEDLAIRVHPYPFVSGMTMSLSLKL